MLMVDYTVFTATYNRAYTIDRVFESLIQQTYTNFEWLIIDDGSSDDTEAKVNEYREKAKFPIRYYWQENKGKHIAMRNGVEKAKGKYFFILDSDDGCLPTTLEKVEEAWNAIDSKDDSGYSAVFCLCQETNGKIVGDKFPEDFFLSNFLDILYKYNIKGEKSVVYKTKVLREFPFPDDFHNKYYPEGQVWNRIAEKYDAIFINEPLRIYYEDNSSLMRGGSTIKKIKRNSITARNENLELINKRLNYFRYSPIAFFKRMSNYIRFSFHSGFGMASQFSELSGFLARTLWIFSLPSGAFTYLKDNYKK